MRNYINPLLLLIPCALTVPAGQAAARENAPQPKIVGYFAEWNVYKRNYQIQDIPAAKLTHINYAFAKIVDGKCAVGDNFAAVEKAYPGDDANGKSLRGNFHQFELLKKKHPHLKTLISVGGWTFSSQFSDASFSQASREEFAKSCVDFITKYHFDGVDLDWEYPGGGGMAGSRTRKEDPANFTLLLAELRKQLDAAGQPEHKHYLLTFAAQAMVGKIEVKKVAALLDWFNVMTYDFHGSWDKATNFNAPLFPVSNDPAIASGNRKYNDDGAIKAWLAAGAPPEKLVLGVPFYGRGWGGVASDNHGLFQAKSKTANGAWNRGSFTYNALLAKYIGKPDYRRYWHEEAKVPWLFDAKTGMMISYDDPQSIKIKAEYAREHKLGGVMIWELGGDDAKASLLSAVQEGLAGK